MIVLKKILVPSDFSPTSAVALTYARAFAEAFGASLDVVHVLEDPMPGWKPSGHVVGVPLIRENMEKDAADQLAKLVTEADRQKFNARTGTIWGNPFVEIVRYAKSQEIDLIVLGSHGHGPLAHMLLGSVAEKVVRKAPCPVLTVRHPEHEFVMP